VFTLAGHPVKGLTMTAPAVLQHAPIRLDPTAMRTARRAAGLTLDDAGRAIRRDGSIVARYERGEVDPPGSVLGALAGAYRVSVNTFYTPRTHP
jgi:predicted transcriptional regulator